MENPEEFFNKYFLPSNVGRSKGKTMLLNFQTDLLYHQEVRKLSSSEDWSEFGFRINFLPKEYRPDLTAMLKVGFRLKGALDTLGETYKFKI